MSFFRRIFGQSPPAEPATPAAIAERHGVPAPDQPRSLQLLAFDSCPYCRRVYRAVERLELDVPVGNIRRDADAHDLLVRLTGRTQVPCLVIDGQPLLESMHILDWLESYKVHGAAA